MLFRSGGHLIPSLLRIHATPVVVPERIRRMFFFTPELLHRWQRWYGLPFPVLLDPKDPLASDVRLFRVFVNPWTARRWTTLGAPALLQTFDLAVSSLTAFEFEARLRLGDHGRLGGFLVHFEADLAEGIRISTEPSCVDKSNHWRIPLWLLPSILKVRAGEKLLARIALGRMPTFEMRVDRS